MLRRTLVRSFLYLAKKEKLNHQMKKILFIVFIFYTHNSFAHNYYFSSNSLTEEKGTIENPFHSLDTISHINFQAGDTIFFHGGDIFNGSISIKNMNGIGSHLIIFTSYQKGSATINSGNKEAFSIYASSNFKISNINFSGSGRKNGNTTDGLRLVNCSDLSLERIDISGFQKSGFFIYDCVNVKVDNILAHDNGACGILVEGDYQKRISNNIHIVNCHTDNNPGDPTNFDNHSGNGILVGNCKNVLIEYCTATNNGWDMPRIGNGPVGIWAYEADSVTIQYCISYKNKTAKGAADGGGFDLDGGVTNSVIQYCLSYDNWGSGYGIYQYNSASYWYNNTVRYCISINDGNITDKASAMLIWNGFNGDSTFYKFYAYNNFFYNDKKYAFAFHPLSAHKQFYFFNNIFIASDTTDILMNLDSSNSDKFLSNVWMKKSGGFSQDGFTDVSKWAAASGYEIYNGKLVGTVFQKNPFTISKAFEITDPYLLKDNSVLHSLCNVALLNKGMNLKKMFGIKNGGKDFFGNPIPTGKGFEPGICEMR